MTGCSPPHDVTGRAPLTHQGKYGARAAGDTVAALAKGEKVDTSPWSPFTATADHHAVPQVVFTDPEVASVGLSDAREGSNDRVVDIDIAVAGSSLHADGYQGKARIVVDTERNVLLGVTFVGQDVSELLHSATIAIVGEVPLDRLWHAVPAVPDDQRGVAAATGGLRALSYRAGRSSAALAARTRPGSSAVDGPGTHTACTTRTDVPSSRLV